MTLPFTEEQFFGVFAEYNRAVWPAQAALSLCGLVLVAVAYRRPAWAARVLGVGLALLWAWMGGVYHLGFFRAINPAARVFGAAFLLQAVLFAVWGLEERPDAVEAARGRAHRVGTALIVYAFVIYPLLGWVLGQRYPGFPTFGLPCPTTIATLGLLVLVRPAVPWWLLVIPLGWVVVGSSAALALGVPEDFGLLAAGIAALTTLRHSAPAPQRRLV